MFDFKTSGLRPPRGLLDAVSAIWRGALIDAACLYANERMLRDIGLSRVDVVDSLSGSLCADPSQLLIAIGSRSNRRSRGFRSDCRH